LFSIATINILDETISLLSVKLSEIKINGEFKPKQGILSQGIVKLVVLITKTT
jgi:hypothetical protein